MVHKLSLTKSDPVIHLKAYGGVQIRGVDGVEVDCEIDAPQLVTMVEEDGHVYITVNSSCNLSLPADSYIQIEKGMGSIEIQHIKNKIDIEKALGNLVLSDISEAVIGKVGGNFAVRNASGAVSVEKVGGNIVVTDAGAFHCEKIGGSCVTKNIAGDFSLEKAGGGLKAQSIGGLTQVLKLGGDATAKQITLNGDLHAGGDLQLVDFQLGRKRVDLRAGGDIQLEIGDAFSDTGFEFHSRGKKIQVRVNADDLFIENDSYDYQIGTPDKHLEVTAGGDISLTGVQQPDEDVVGDVSDHFGFEESAFSEMIRERIESATRRAEAKIKTAEIRLEQMKEHMGKVGDLDINVDFGDLGNLGIPKSTFSGVPPVPPVSRPAGKKGATNEERLMILKMLQDKKITVDEAEKLFKALEN